MQYLVTAGVILNRPLAYRENPRKVLGRTSDKLNSRFAGSLIQPLTRFGSHDLLVGAVAGGGTVPWIIIDLLLETWPEPYGIVIEAPFVVARPTSGMMTLGVRRERILFRGPLDAAAYRAATLLWEDTVAGWTAHRVDTLRLLRELGRQRCVAETTGVTQQAVSDTLRRAHWPRLRKSLKMVGRSLP